MLDSMRIPAYGAALLLGLFTAPAPALELSFQAASAEDYRQPHDIVLAPDGKALYVSDVGNDRIAVLDPMSLRELGAFAEGEVDQPHDVVFDARGRLLVADTGNSRIAIYAISGTQGRLVGSIEEAIRRPEGVAVHPDGRVLATGAASGNLVEYRAGRMLRELGGLSSPHDVEIDSRGRIWVADANNNRVVLIGPDFTIERELGERVYGFNGPRYLDFDASGNLYVADKYSNRIRVIAPDGRMLKVLGTPQSGKGPGLFDRPEGVEILGRDVWFSDTYNNRIVRYRID